MSANKNLLVRLRPAGRFFFGTGGGSGVQDYYLKTASFPQQTALLGLLRYQLLIQNNQLKSPAAKIENEGDATKLVGPSSFIANSKVAQSFGVILGMGPCGIYDSDADELYLPCGPEYAAGYSFQQVEGLYFRGNEPARTSAIALPSYDHKASYSQRFMGHKGCILQHDEIFEPTESPGITKDYGGRAASNAYYKQSWLRFKAKRFEYAFGLQLNTAGISFGNNLVHFGKERSVFAMQMAEWAHDFPAPAHTEAHKTLVLQSDAFAEDDHFLPLAAFAINQGNAFRNYVNHIGQPVKDYYNRRTADSNRKNLQLMSRGSVFIYSNQKNLQKASELLMAQTAFRTIGYNHFITC
jgi:CRISPR-associated protein Cmr3